MSTMTETSRQRIMSDSEMIATAQSTRSDIIALVVIALLTGIVLAVLIIRSLTAPMKKAVAMLTELDKGHLGDRLQMNRHDEIGQVIQQNTASAEESAATSEELSGQAAELKNQLGHFA